MDVIYSCIRIIFDKLINITSQSQNYVTSKIDWCPRFGSILSINTYTVIEGITAYTLLHIFSEIYIYIWEYYLLKSIKILMHIFGEIHIDNTW